MLRMNVQWNTASSLVKLQVNSNLHCLTVNHHSGQFIGKRRFRRIYVSLWTNTTDKRCFHSCSPKVKQHKFGFSFSFQSGQCKFSPSYYLTKLFFACENIFLMLISLLSQNKLRKYEGILRPRTLIFFYKE